jgi:two-component system, cell cycle sensor histidine kinase PleC
VSLLQNIGVPNGPSPSFSSESERDGRVAMRMRTLQSEALEQAVLSAVANLPAMALFAFIIRNSASELALCLWIATAAGILSALVALVRDLLPGITPFASRRPSHRLAIQAVFAALIGALWGVAALAFAPGLNESGMMFFTVIVLGCNAACISGIGPYLPAFFGYCAASSLPLVCALYLRHEAVARDMVLLVFLYLAVVGGNARAYNRQVLSAFRLRAENEVLAENVTRANVATAEAHRSKWNTLAHLSHELRTPMNAIMGFSQMMRDQIFGPLAERYRDYSHHIHDSGHHLLNLIDTILDVSRAEAGHLTIDGSVFAPADLMEECLQVVSASAAAKHLVLERQFAPSATHIVADRTKLRRALLNLLTNAIDYTREGGCVAVCLSNRDGGIEIAVIDTGIGIAPEDIERCLEPFERLANPLIATAEGAGLGLPLARRLTEAHGGDFRLESEPGRGTIATIFLPAARCFEPDAERRYA